MFARELATPDGAVTALGVFRDRMRRSVPPLVRRIARNGLAGRPQLLDGRDDLVLLAGNRGLGDALALVGGNIRNRAVPPRLCRPLRSEAEQLAGALRLELARADRRRRLGYARALQGVMASLRRETKLGVLLRASAERSPRRMRSTRRRALRVAVRSDRPSASTPRGSLQRGMVWRSCSQFPVDLRIRRASKFRSRKCL